MTGLVLQGIHMINDSNQQTIQAIQTIHIDYTDGNPLAAEDPRVPFARAVQGARAVTDLVSTTNALRPSPCDDWTALDVARHLVSVLDRVTGAAEGADLMNMPILSPSGASGVANDLAAAATRVHAAWSDDAALTTLMTLPFGVLPGAAALGAYTSELHTHTWDLATAIGVELNWPEADLEVGVAMAKFAIPSEGRDDPAMPFGHTVDVLTDASLIEQLVAWVGRDPR